MSAVSAKIQSLEELASQIRVCTKCPLCESRKHAVPGEGEPFARVMIIGEAPGRDEDESGRPFVGASGRFLNHVLEGTGIGREQIFITNIVKCRPPKNRTPRKREADVCSSNYLFEQIEQINPALIVLLAAVATKTVLGLDRVQEVRGRILERDGRKYFATYHPAVQFYRADWGQAIHEDFALLKLEFQELYVRQPKGARHAARRQEQVHRQTKTPGRAYRGRL